jgi:large subunit ribosomal protein L7e
LEYTFCCPTILTKFLKHRSVPTKNDILVPETILKKRKSQEKEREQRATELDKKRKVGPSIHSLPFTANERRK